MIEFTVIITLRRQFVYVDNTIQIDLSTSYLHF